jgi:hypothetical protein
LEELAEHELISYVDGYKGYHWLKVALEGQLKTTFIKQHYICCYIVMSFGLWNAPVTFQRLINKVLEPYLGHFIRVFINDYYVYRSGAHHLTKGQMHATVILIPIVQKHATGAVFVV